MTATNAIGTSAASDASNSVVPVVPEVGSFYGGGVVFYIFENGDTGYVAGETHGLIAAVADQSLYYNGIMVVMLLQGQQDSYRHRKLPIQRQLYLHKGEQKHLMQQAWQGHILEEDIPIGFYLQKMS